MNNKEKIVEKLNKWVQEEFGSLYRVEDDGDLTLLADGNCVAWFADFKKHEFRFAQSDDDLNVKLIKEGILEKFYDKAIESLTKHEPKYTVQVLPSEYGFLYKLKNDLSYLTTSDIGNDCTFIPQWGYFTQPEIDELKQRDDLAINWNKAIIKEVE